MKLIFKKTLMNYAMIQIVIFSTSVIAGMQIPLSSGHLPVISFVWIMMFGVSFLPAAFASFLFAYLSE